MARLVVMHDPLRGVREHHRLTEGATLADELRRLYPQGFGGQWMLHEARALADGEIAASLHEQLIVDSDAIYIVTVRPSGPVPMFIGKLILSAIISYAIGRLLQERPRRRDNIGGGDEDKQSPNNKIAGQSNELRAGARVPEILGRVRSYPDLLTPALEKWLWPRTQTIMQWFAIGMGEYEISGRRLGDTSVASISGISWNDYAPGATIATMQASRFAPTVDNISLNAQETATTVTGVDFDGDDNTVTADERIAIELWTPYFITGTFLNTVDAFVIGIPDEAQTVGPYVYELDGNIVDEASVNAVFTPSTIRGNKTYYQALSPGATTNEILLELTATVTGDLVYIKMDGYGVDPEFIWVGRALDMDILSGDGGVFEAGQMLLRVENMDGTLPVFPARFGPGTFRSYIPLGVTLLGVPILLVDTPQYTDWFTAPIEEPDEIWIDFEFPNGLAHFISGGRTTFSVSINVQFREVAVPATVVTKTYTYTAASNVEQRVTEVTTLTELGMVGPIEVRMIRNTPIPVDTGTEQFLNDTRWRSLRAIKNIPPHSYADVSVEQVLMFNTSSAASIGESTLNLVATRKLPTWDGSAWTEPAATEKWADNIVARMKANDGAFKTDEQIDIAGIYALQAALDAMDGGDQGKISMTLDELQDIDGELQTIASVVRCLVYRIGSKLFVTRDEGGKIPLALFTGRSKSPDGEQVQLAMKNDTEHDAVLVTWFDRANGWKQREYQYPEDVVPLNALRVTPVQATWAQAWRRAVYEWNRLQYRRDVLSMEATEEARLIHVGDVINVTDDLANLAQSAGEVYEVDDLILWLDRETDISAGGFTIMLRGQDGRSLDSMAVIQGPSLREVVLDHAPSFAIQGRHHAEGLGTMYAIFQTASAVIRPWLVTNLDPGVEYTRVAAVNWREEVFEGDTATLPATPAFSIVRGLPRDI